MVMELERNLENEIFYKLSKVNKNVVELLGLPDKVVNEGEKKGLTFNCKKKESMLVSKKDSSRCEVAIVEVKISHIEKLNYLRRFSQTTNNLTLKSESTLKSERCLPKFKQSIK